MTIEIQIKLKRKMFEFTSEQYWVNTAKNLFQGCGVHKSDYICIDSDGTVCRMGLQFMNATKNDLYPVTVYELE